MRRAISSFAALGAVLLMALPAQASGAGAVSFTQNMHNVTSTFDVVNPCTNQSGTVTETYNAVLHVTVLTSGVGAGTGWFTFTISGDITLVQTNGVTYTGHMTGWDGGNMNLQNFTGTDIFIVTANGSDGTHISFHAVAHITVVMTNSSPTVVVQFAMGTCN